MRMLDKRVMVTHRPGRAPICPLVTYVSPDEPILLRRCGWEIADDVHDDFVDVISRDNGQTWGEPRPALKNVPVEGGYITFTEGTGIFIAERNRLIVFIYQKFHATLARHDGGQSSAKLHITVTDPRKWLDDPSGSASSGQPLVSDFGFRQGLAVSFCRPIEDSRRRVLVPVGMQMCDDAQRTMQRKGLRVRNDLPDVLLDVFEPRLLIGEFVEDDIHWHISGTVAFDVEQALYLCEGTIAELEDGQFIQILRGTNAPFPDRPGYKWLSASDDGGETWSPARPLACDDGSIIQSSATGSALLRSIKNGKLYWIGNLCLGGEKPIGNMPRYPLLIAEVQEDPVALKRDTFAIIDTRAPGEGPHVQHSNFRFYQDRVTGDVVLYLTRYGERGWTNDDGQWIKADSYQYRICID